MTDPHAALVALHAAASAYREVAEHPGGNVDTIQDVARDDLDAALVAARAAIENAEIGRARASLQNLSIMGTVSLAYAPIDFSQLLAAALGDPFSEDRESCWLFVVCSALEARAKAEEGSPRDGPGDASRALREVAAQIASWAGKVAKPPGVRL